MPSASQDSAFGANMDIGGNSPKLEKSRSRSSSSIESDNSDIEKEKFSKSKLHPHKDILKEHELLVKIADLGNACWTVSLS
jgi:protein required for attachment to host cells